MHAIGKKSHDRQASQNRAITPAGALLDSPPPFDTADRLGADGI